MNKAVPLLCAFSVFFCLCGWRTSSGQEAEQRFRTGIDLVTVDVVVLDRGGQPLHGLARADFTILEDGRSQEIREFQSVELPPASTAPASDSSRRPPHRRVSINSVTAGRLPGRAFVLVFDDVNLSRQQGAESKKAIRQFLQSVTNEDAISLVTTSGGGWFHARTADDRARLLAMLDRIEGKYVYDTSAERMTDNEALRIHIFQDTLAAARVRRRYEYYRVAGREPITTPNNRDDMPRVGETPGNVGVVEPYLESRAAAVYSEAVQRNRVTMGVLERALDAMQGTRGRKSLILVSKGFIHDPETRGFRDVTRAARRANVAIYFLDARGLVATTSNFTASEGSPVDARDIGAAYADIALDAEGAVSIAEDSGGFAIRNTNDLSAGLGRLARESRSYYLIGYVPTSRRADGKFRKIEVKVGRPDVQVRARKGYFAPDASDAPLKDVGELDPDVRRALDAPRDVADVPVRTTALVFDRGGASAANVVIATDVDTKYFQLAPGADDRLVGIVEYAVAATHLETGQVFTFEQTTELNLRPETKRRLDLQWYSLSREFKLPTGSYQAKAVVRDRTSGRIGSVTHEFEVPPLEGFRVASPILTDRVQSDGAQQAPKPVLVARRAFASGTTLFCQFTAYNAAVRASDRQPEVSGAWILRRANGDVVRQTAPTAVVPSPDGVLTRMYGIALAGLTPGDYELVLIVRDELQSQTVELREPFTVGPGVGVPGR